MGDGNVLACSLHRVENEKPRALVVDDDEPIRSMLSWVMEHQGFNVSTGRDGGEAIEQLAVGKGYDIVLLDLMMPGVDGFSVLDWMREKNPSMLDCTIVTTALNHREIARRLADTVYRVHQKPFDMTRLMSDVRHCSERKGERG